MRGHQSSGTTYPDICQIDLPLFIFSDFGREPALHTDWDSVVAAGHEAITAALWVRQQTPLPHTIRAAPSDAAAQSRQLPTFFGRPCCTVLKQSWHESASAQGAQPGSS